MKGHLAIKSKWVSLILFGTSSGGFDALPRSFYERYDTHCVRVTSIFHHLVCFPKFYILVPGSMIELAVFFGFAMVKRLLFRLAKL